MRQSEKNTLQVLAESAVKSVFGFMEKEEARRYTSKLLQIKISPVLMDNHLEILRIYRRECMTLDKIEC